MTMKKKSSNVQERGWHNNILFPILRRVSNSHNRAKTRIFVRICSFYRVRKKPPRNKCDVRAFVGTCICYFQIMSKHFMRIIILAFLMSIIFTTVGVSVVNIILIRCTRRVSDKKFSRLSWCFTIISKFISRVHMNFLVNFEVVFPSIYSLKSCFLMPIIVHFGLFKIYKMTTMQNLGWWRTKCTYAN